MTESDFPIGQQVRLAGHFGEPLRIQNSVKHPDYAKREVVAARYFDIPGEAIKATARKRESDHA